jgi:hypothetical protein
LLQPERNATLMIDVLGSYVGAGKFRLHEIRLRSIPIVLLTWQKGKRRGLKPRMAYIITARLKPCPDTDHPEQSDLNQWSGQAVSPAGLDFFTASEAKSFS